MSARLDLPRREIVIGGLPNPIPPQDQRTALHRELDAALDAVAENDKRPGEPQGPGRIADHEQSEP